MTTKNSQDEQEEEEEEEIIIIIIIIIMIQIHANKKHWMSVHLATPIIICHFFPGNQSPASPRLRLTRAGN